MPRPYPEPQQRKRRTNNYSVALSPLEAEALEREATLNDLPIAECLRNMIRQSPSFRYLANNRHHAAIAKDTNTSKQDNNQDVKSAA